MSEFLIFGTKELELFLKALRVLCLITY